MPHLVLLYTPNVDQQIDMGGLCNSLADGLCAQRDSQGQPIFPTGGVRVMAYPAAYSAVADRGAAGREAGNSGDYGFIYLNLRMAKGRSPAVHLQVGEAIAAIAHEHLNALFGSQPLGLTVQIDEGMEVFNAKHSSLHPLFAPAAG
jgi:5-carboxymethyl-2-hydroxymuconate isomerase